MNIYKLMINREKALAFHNLSSALDHMSCCVEEDSSKHCEGKNHYELVHDNNDNTEILLEFPKEEEENHTISDLQPLLKKFFSSGDGSLEEYLHDFTNNIHILYVLQKQKFTIVEGNNNILDLIKHADLTEYSIMYCQTCKKLQHVTVEGTEGVLLFTCDECNQIVSEVYQVEEIITV
ncbi:MAG: hypothetical protein GOP50_02010 [Candidatus Heimdallarchaeota archaeon]|nr:hypothetical protein [Candidatus Heimdallarchaeota archaeon]